jgi:hypothetical protein
MSTQNGRVRRRLPHRVGVQLNFTLDPEALERLRVMVVEGRLYGRFLSRLIYEEWIRGGYDVEVGDAPVLALRRGETIRLPASRRRGLPFAYMGWCLACNEVFLSNEAKPGRCGKCDSPRWQGRPLARDLRKWAAEAQTRAARQGGQE